MDDIKRTFVTGWPVEHSRSPIIHNHWLAKAGITGEYLIRPRTVDDFQSFIKSFASEGFLGGNVTIPHKETAYELVDELDAAAKRLGAVNTVWLEDGVLKGGNTDGYGFLANLDDRAPGWDDKDRIIRGALVLGAGGAARAIVDGLVERGFSPVFIANRTVERAQALADKFGESCEAISLDDVGSASAISFVVNTTSIGMNDDQSPLDLAGFENDIVVNDIVYTPLITPLLKQASQLGLTPVDGLGMLLHQAVPGFERWFGIHPEVTEELRALVITDLGEPK